MSLRRSLAPLAGLVLATAVLTVVPTSPLLAQDDQEEAIAYHAWFAANNAKDNAKAVEAAEAYLEKFPSGQYAEFLNKWLASARVTSLEEAMKAGDIDKMLVVGRAILATDPENLNIIIALANQLRQRELLARPRSFAHAADAVELSQKAIGLVESGKTLAGVQNFDKDATLAQLYQNLAIVEGKDGASEKAIGLYEKSTGLAPQDVGIAGRNLLELLSWRQSAYADAANAYNALPDEARAAAEPSEEVTAARARVDSEADALIDVSARFVALAEVKSLPQATRDKVYAVLEKVYQSRNPDDAEAAGLRTLIDSKK